MFLKRLEIIGFKSFAERIGIDFVPGVTAIVGPNGSGKSNITDAIRWVLGEQSAKSLRGAKMEDVIFAGSDSRKSLNFAEVTLILDNSKGLFPLDYTEISVSRRVFRSGESVYLLNGQQCRLKDIQNVFMDSGLGKEAFSIISQGRVDEILNSKPEDRRSIFDEAAGVLKYKTRKRQASFKLIETEDNLDRVLDILKELDDRLEPLRKNAEAAKKYEVLSEQIRAADVQLLNYESMSLQQKIAQEATAIQAIEKRKETIEQDVLQVERQATQTKEQLAKLDQFLDEQQQQLMDVRTEIEKWEGRRLLSDEKRRNNEQQLARILKEIATVEQESVTIRQRLSVSTQSYEKTTDALQQVAEEIDHISNMLKRSAREIEKEIDELKTVYIDRLNEEATVRNDLKHLDDRIANEQQSSERILQQTTLLQQQLQRLQNEKKERQQHVQSLQQQATSLQKMIDQANSELKEKEAILANEQQMLQKALNRQHEMQGRVRVLQSLEEDFSGFYSGVREVLIARKQKKLQGIDGAVAELITVDPVHTKAIEVALGGAMQHIITETEANARQAINYLKMKNAGRATFLPRNIMKARQIPASLLHQVRQQSEFVGTADQLIQTDVNYRHIIGNLLGQTMVAETLEGATALAKKIGYRYRIVTLDGDLVNAGGSLTGGGVKSQTTVFSRKAELEALKKQLSKMSRSIEGATTKVSESKMMVARLMQDTDSMRSQFEAIQRDKAIADSRLQETIMEIRTVESEITTSEIGRRGAQSASSELLEKQRQLQENHQLLKAELETIQQSVTTLERLASDRRNEEATLLQKMTTLREQAATLKTEKAFHKSTIQQAKTTLQQLEQRLDMLQQEQQIMEGHEQSIELTPEELQQRLYNCQQTQRQIENTVTMKRAERSELATLLQQFEQQLSQLRQEMEEIHHAYREKTVELSKLEVKFESVTQHLLEEYGLYPDDSAFVPFNVEETRVRVEMLKRERESLGTINPSSIEEYEEVSERYHFLTEQRNDLLEAKQTLNQAMSEMDREMETRFETTFKAVRARFHHVFKEMFGGGDADLILTTPDNLLETGVEIVARPPGKKLQSLSLLSGGERALTAITLLFAIIEVRPVPFVILDEVEAALDEANVLRYSNYLKRFSDQTQFIVITHRKGTMEGADVLYGVTMQESGVSKLISVKLSEVPVEAMK